MTVLSEPATKRTLLFLHGVFFVSGFAAILYQIVWQRSLFTIYGTSTESVTIVVTAFMLGLGLGSLAGGVLSARSCWPLPVLFGAAEVAIGLFGFVSLPLFHWMAGVTRSASGATIGIVTLLAVAFPTALMGATLPLLSAHEVRRLGHVGRSVGVLYAVNALGSAGGCLAAAGLLMASLGQTGVVRMAAILNLLVGLSVLLPYVVRGRRP